ncbi:hypothetical protein [Ureibacillus aquaedulcis]|uniref:Spo0E like sporulation regulatory protein n=1 Tax=Ureibacillus aquaedulcis TaxID=3058421 RepID=A0ABT8GWA9_9BACL|nr:hypothetical protein [Ureibacillus sp. BA0131]MDN4495539.1 hypothetical protein [Ureibacillus sp. BA0131]
MAVEQRLSQVLTRTRLLCSDYGVVFETMSYSKEDVDNSIILY